MSVAKVTIPYPYLYNYLYFAFQKIEFGEVNKYGSPATMQ